MPAKVPAPEKDLDSLWSQREIYWRRKLGRLRLGVEPIEEQLARYRRVTWVLTAVPALIGLMFVTLFTVFGRPDIGLVFVAVILLPIVIGAWVDYAILAKRARRYLIELSQYLGRNEPAMTGSSRQETASEQA